MKRLVYGCNPIAIEVDDVEKAVGFHQDVFNLPKLDEGKGDAFFKLDEHQVLAMFEVEELRPDRLRHFGIMVRDEEQLAEVRDKIAKKYGLELIPGFRCDFHDPFGNRIQVVDLHNESLVWLLPFWSAPSGFVTGDSTYPPGHQAGISNPSSQRRGRRGERAS